MSARDDTAAQQARLQAQLAQARSDAAYWERSYRRLRDQPPVRAIAAARRLVRTVAGRPPVLPPGPRQLPVPPLPPPPPPAPPAPPMAPPAPTYPQPPRGTAPFSVPYREPAGRRGIARLDPANSQRRFEAFDTILDVLPTGRLVDLGAGHGLFAKRAADSGWDVTAVDARTERFPDDERIRWVHQDIREHDLGQYDVVVCLGLFYHLTLADQRDLLSRSAGRPLVLDTHVDVGIEYGDDRLGSSVEEDGYRGRLYGEHLESPLASWVNETSFWPDLDSFYRLLQDNGYAVTLALEPWYAPDRTFFLALPASGGSAT